MKKRKNIVFYFEDKQGFGHACGFKSLFDALSKDFNILLFFSWNNRRHHFLQWVKTVFLPFHEGYNKKLKEQKCKLIREFLYDFNPDIFFMDYYPFWKYQLRHEMREIIGATKKNNGKVYTFMRDIYIWEQWMSKNDYEYHKISLEKEFWRSITEQLELSGDEVLRKIIHNLDGQVFRVNLFFEHYLSHGLIDKVLMFGDENIHKIENELHLPWDLKKKFHYLGYICPEIGVRYKKTRKKTNKIIVSSWWNITSEKQFLQLLLNLNKLKGYQVDVFLWDFIREDYKNFIIQYFESSNTIQIWWFVTDFREKLIEYDFYFGFGGYGTFLDLLYDGIPSFIFPNFDNKIFADRKLEQENRIKLLEWKVNMFPLEKFSVEYIQQLLNTEYENISWDIHLAQDSDIISLLQTLKIDD